MIRSILSFAALAFTLASPFAQAQTIDVEVQCDVDGPVYAGTLALPDAAGFACKGSSNDYYAVNAKQPYLVLTFNQLTYGINPSDVYTDAYANGLQACKKDIAKGLALSREYDGNNNSGSQTASELVSSLTVVAHTYFDDKGNFVNGDVGRCAFEVKK